MPTTKNKKVPASIGGCGELRTLDISYNKCKELPASVGDLGKLEVFNASSCRLVSAPPVPASAALRAVYLGHNRLTRVEGAALLRAPNTTELLLNNNLLEELPQEVSALVRLKIVDFGCNNLQSVPTGLGYLPDLGRIVYAGNPCEVHTGRLPRLL